MPAKSMELNNIESHSGSDQEGGEGQTVLPRRIPMVGVLALDRYVPLVVIIVIPIIVNPAVLPVLGPLVFTPRLPIGIVMGRGSSG